MTLHPNEMRAPEGTALLEEVRKIPIKYANTKDSEGKDRNVNSCPLFDENYNIDNLGYCFKNHAEIINLDNEVKVDYRKCNAFRLVSKLKNLKI